MCFWILTVTNLVTMIGHLNILLVQYLMGDAGETELGEKAKEFSERLVDVMKIKTRPIFLSCQRGSQKKKKD